MIGAALWDLLLFATLVFGLGAACAPAWTAKPGLALTAGAALALGLAFLVGFLAFAAGWSNDTAAAAVALLGAAVLVTRRRAARALLATPAVRALLAAWLVFAGWSLGLLALVVTYSGGGWSADWFEHWQRTLFFLHRQPLDTRFAVIYSLTARPPLANLVIALFLAGTSATFAHYQVFMTLLGSLIVLPAWLLAQRWRPRPRAGWVVVLLLMLNPLVAQNLTFAWTKLPTAFFVLAALCFTLDDLDPGPAAGSLVMAALCLALGMLTHYSAGPWIVAMAVAFVATRRSAWQSVAFWRGLVRAAVTFAAVLAVWLVWAMVHFGWHGTVQSNTTAEAWTGETPAQRIATPLLNIADTIIPFPLRGEPSDGLITQASRLGRLRDVAFNVYQVNLPLALGLGGLWILAWTWANRKRRTPVTTGRAASPRFLAIALPLAAIIGIVVHTPRDEWGLAHICLQPLVLMGLAAAAAALPALTPAARRVWAALALVDLALGIGLHFGLESWALAPFVAPAGDRLAYVRMLNRAAAANANDKWAFHVVFFSDRLHAPLAAVVVALALLLLLAGRLARRSVPGPA